MLSDVAIRDAKPRTKPYKLSDEKGLYLYVTPKTARYRKGCRSWRYDYRLAGKRRTVAYGHYPDVTLADARDRHSEARRLVARGLDPVAARRKSKEEAARSAVNTFRAIAETWHAELAPHRSAVWQKNTRRWLDARIYPTIGDRPADLIEPGEILDLIRGIANEGHANSAECIRQLVSRVFRYGVRNMRCKSDPAHVCRGSIVVPPAVHHRPLSAKELPGFLEAIESYGGRYPTIAAVRLLLLTMVRKSELLGARWGELDLDSTEPLWRIPMARMKARADHLVPLAHQAAALFLEQKKFACGSGFVFPSLGRLDEHMSTTTLNRMFERLGVAVTPHGLRATASTILNESGHFRPDVIERALAHADRDRVRASYNTAQYLPERRRMLQYWADLLDALKQNETNVVPFRGAA
jgi:integrase